MFEYTIDFDDACKLGLASERRGNRFQLFRLTAWGYSTARHSWGRVLWRGGNPCRS